MLALIPARWVAQLLVIGLIVLASWPFCASRASLNYNIYHLRYATATNNERAAIDVLSCKSC